MEERGAFFCQIAIDFEGPFALVHETPQKKNLRQDESFSVEAFKQIGNSNVRDL